MVLWSSLVPAVIQRADSVEPLAWGDTGVLQRAVVPWGVEMSQPLWLPGGRLEGFRVAWWRPPWPQVGGALEGRLVLDASAGAALGASSVPLVPRPLSRTHAMDRWEEIRLAHPIDLPGDTAARLHLRFREPRLAAGPFWIHVYASPETDFPRVGGMRANDEPPKAVALWVAAIYRERASRPLQP